MIQKHSPINTKLVIIGLFFFINPNISIVDIFPDFIGAALIVTGILHFSDIDNRAFEAKKKLTTLAFADLAKTLCLLLLLNSKGTVWSLIFTLCFGVAETVLFIFAMYNLFTAITYRAMRETCEPLYSKFQSIFPITTVFTVVRSILSMLPEFTALTSDFGFVDSFIGDKDQLLGFIKFSLTALNLLVVFAYGLGWWLYVRKYFKLLSKQTEFNEALEEMYQRDVGTHPEILTHRGLKTTATLFSAGAFFLLPMKLSGNDMLPDFVGAALFILGLIRMYKLYKEPCKKALIAGGGYFLFSLGEWIYEFIFNKSFIIDKNAGYYESVSAILKYHPEHLPAYYGLLTVSILKYLILAWFLYQICNFFLPIIKNHTGSAFDGAYKTAVVQKFLEKKRKVLIALSFVAVATGIIFRCFRMFSESMFIQYVDLIGTGIFFSFLMYFLTKLDEAIDNKYYCERV